MRIPSICATTIAIGAVVVLTAGCTTKEDQVISSLERILESLQQELDTFRDDGTGEVPGAEAAYVLEPVGSVTRTLVTPPSGGDPYLRTVIDGWGFWGVLVGGGPAGTEPLFRATITAQADLNENDPIATSSFGAHGQNSLSNPTFSAFWSGEVRALEAFPSYAAVEGDALLEFNSDIGALDITLSNFDNGYEDIRWTDILVTDGSFHQDLDPRYYRIGGSFYGTNHEGVAGAFDTFELFGIYAAVRDETYRVGD